jgi:2-polyprenyl-6-methoxyphenol hydroxylase-like FAD-dependent oxidoreductase
VAPGYIAWIAEDGQSVHVGVGGYPARFQPSAALDEFRSTLGPIVKLRIGKLVDRRGGRIPVGGILANLANHRGLLIGDAAGAVSPLTAGGLDPCLRLTELAAKVIWQFLSSGEQSRLTAYDGRQFRGQFLVRRALRTAFSLAAHNPILEAGCAVLRSRAGHQIAERMFFGRGSFPDISGIGGPPRVAGSAPVLGGKPQNSQTVSVN